MNYNPAMGASGKFTGWHFLAVMIVSFGVVFSVNGYFIYEALSTFDGIEVPDAYQKGRAYNDVIDAMAAQKARGWTSSLDVSASGAPQGTHVALTLADKAGKPLEAMKVEATFWRPVTAGLDQREPMKDTGAGRYEAEFRLPYDGNWIVRIAAISPGGEKFVEEKRVYIKAR